jgi:metal-responsive CopG/Arc/MetJ family transcriptional regulator
MTGYTRPMKTAISLPDADFERFDRLAAANNMSRSEFYRAAAERFARELEDSNELTAIANAALLQIGDDDEMDSWLEASRRRLGSTDR